MPTFLVTKQMSPELAARVQAAVSGPPREGATVRRPLTALVRLLTLVFAITAVVGVVHFRRQRARELENLRAELRQLVAQQAAKLSRTDRELPSRVAAAIALYSAPTYPGDQVAEDLRSNADLTTALGLPTLYLRGPLEGLAQPGRVSELATSSVKDAFLLCLLAPPEARTERALKAKASSAHRKQEEVTTHFERVAPLLQALPLLDRAWRERIELAETLGALHGLQRLLEAAPLDAAVRAAKARQLLLVLDETSTAAGPTELDGERPHSVRVILSDLRSGETRLRFRHAVDPGWLSDVTRAQFASGVDSCALAVDLRSAAATLPPL